MKGIVTSTLLVLLPVDLGPLSRGVLELEVANVRLGVRRGFKQSC